MADRKRRKKNIFGDSERPRLVVFRSLKNFYGQIVDDSAQKTLMGISSLNQDVKVQLAKSKSKQEASKILGKILAEKARELKIKKVIFDRNGYAYHGRVKAFAEGAREGGLEF